MNLEALTEKYIASAETILATLQPAHNQPQTVTPQKIINLIDHAKNYLQDAKYYKNQKNLEVSLTSIAYCEGILDALKLIGAVNFKWPTNPPKKPPF